jgi:hypothetical protein
MGNWLNEPDRTERYRQASSRLIVETEQAATGCAAPVGPAARADSGGNGCPTRCVRSRVA